MRTASNIMFVRSETKLASEDPTDAAAAANPDEIDIDQDDGDDDDEEEEENVIEEQQVPRQVFGSLKKGADQDDNDAE